MLQEPVVLEGRSYALRHIGPQSHLYPQGVPIAQSTYTVLNQTTMVGRALPMADMPNSTDFVSGSWTGRVNDAGEFTLTFPNKEASDGTPWRNRFDPSFKNEWIEILNDGYLEAVCCIEKVDLKRDQIIISGHDGFWQTKNAYERDWIVVQAPRDVIERGTQVWQSIIADNFPSTSSITGPATTLTTPTTTWTLTNGGSFMVSPSGLVVEPSSLGGGAGMASPTFSITDSGAWSITMSFTAPTLASGHAPTVALKVTESLGNVYELDMALALGTQGGTGSLLLDSNLEGQIIVPTDTAYSLLMESDGEYIWAYVNGQLIPGGIQRAHSITSSLQVSIVASAGGVPTIEMLYTGVQIKTLQPFLMAGGTTDKGDFALPGSASTYPNGGLHARYYNNADLAGDSSRLVKIHHHGRSQAYVGSTGGPGEYANQQDSTIDNQSNAPGAAGNYWSCIWFGAIYLKLSAGNYEFQLITQSNTGARVYIGKTKFGDQLYDNFSLGNPVTVGYINVTAANLAGTLSYNPGFGVSTGTEIRDGWYPIKIEYFVDLSGTTTAPVFNWYNTPVSYTDPGGTTIPLLVNTARVVDSTSLSPLGCVDQRHQGISHFDLIQKTAQAFGHQFACEPHSLESSFFPGILAPRWREGADYDAKLEPDDNERKEGMLNYGNTLDATDTITTLQGNGAGFQNGNTGQLQGYVYDPVSLQESLFDVEGWQDFSDAAFASLLGALLNSNLGTRLQPWQSIVGDPVGRERLAIPWPIPVPLTDSLSQMRWRPGDGLFVYARDVRIEDTAPRQLLMVQRSIHPNGTTGVAVTFMANESVRPRGTQYQLNQRLFQATRWQRNYQKQLVTLTGTYAQNSIAANSDTTGSGVFQINKYSAVTLQPGDIVVRAWVRFVVNLANLATGIGINGQGDVTSTLNGPWTTTPAMIDITPVAIPDSFNRLLVYLINKNVTTPQNDVEWQVLVDVLR